MLALLMVSADFCSDDGRRTLENAWNRRSASQTLAILKGLPKKKSPKLMKLYPRSPFDLNKVGLLIDMLLILVGYPLEPTSHRSFSNLACSPIVNLEFFLNKSAGRLGRPLI